MRFVGVDLAWGQRARTGLAVVDESGRLLEVADARTDDEIIGWLRPWTAGPCVVAIDAPLIVMNAYGLRQCERLVARHFGRYHLAAHAANTANPNFEGGDTRGLRIATALGLDPDPASPAVRKAIEVYPHLAIVMLFGLARPLQYKHKQGRHLNHLRAEAMRLISFLDGLSTADIPLKFTDQAEWRSIRERVERAERKVDLKRVEDRIDAVVCAYVAEYATARPGAVRVLGDSRTGYIVTPVTPEMALRLDTDATPTNGPRRLELAEDVRS